MNRISNTDYNDVVEETLDAIKRGHCREYEDGDEELECIMKDEREKILSIKAEFESAVNNLKDGEKLV